MTGNSRPEVGQLVASAEGAEGATSNSERDEGGCHPTLRFELSVGTGGGRADNTAIDLEKAVKFAPCARDKGMQVVPDPTSRESLVDASRIPSAAGRGVGSISGFQAAADQATADECAADDSGELGLRVQ